MISLQYSNKQKDLST